MTSKILGLTTVALAAAAFATQAGAQGAPLTLSGATPPGVCSFSGDRAVAESTAGKYVSERLGELSTQVKAELDAEQNGIQTDAATLDSQKASLSQDQYQSQGAALQTRAAALQRKAQQREAEMQATQRKAIQTIEATLAPVVQQVAQGRACTLLISTDALVLPNPSIDITDQVMTGLNAKLTQFPVEREHLDQPAAGQ